jgi:hypothetical protein
MNAGSKELAQIHHLPFPTFEAFTMSSHASRSDICRFMKPYPAKSTIAR